MFGSRYKPLTGSFDVFTREEVLEGENGYFCEKCNKNKAKSQAKGTATAAANGAAERQAGGTPNGKARANGVQKKVKETPIRTKATKQFLIKEYPDVLIIHLKRFSQNFLRGGLKKISGHVSFPVQLDLSEYAKPLDTGFEKHLYNLTGVVVHGGNLGGGHYTAYVREGCDTDFRGGWYYCSDTHVARAKETQVLQSEAYLLFYERKERRFDPVEAATR